MKQHYSPVFYLRGFTDPVIRKPKKAELWEYTIAAGAWNKRRPREIAWEHDYYESIDEDGERHDQVDHRLQEIETFSAPSLRKIAAGEPFDGSDLVNLAVFISSMVGRSPGRLDGFGNGILEMQVEILRKKYGERMRMIREQFPSFLAELLRGGFEISDQMRAEHLNPQPHKHRLRINRGVIAGASIRSSMRLAPLFLKSYWALLESEPPDFYIVSDRPYFLNERVGAATFPLTRNLAVSLRPDKDPVEGMSRVFQVKADASVVRAVNGQTMAAATRFIGSPVCEFPGSDLIGLLTREDPPSSGTPTFSTPC